MAGESNLIRAYGDRRDDGVIQLSFTLPVALSARAKEAALLFCEKLGLHDIKVASAEAAANEYSFFVVYARADVAIDYQTVHAPVIAMGKLGFDDLNALIEQRVGRRIVVVGACTGSDTHTVGIDAILNMKGFAGDYGLERYPYFEAHNMGSQVPNKVLIARARELSADAILVSQVVTQREVHKDNSKEFIEEVKAAGLYGKVTLLMGGPRVDHKLALALGFDAGFGPGTKPSDVANFIAHSLLKRLGREDANAHYQGEPT